MLSLFFLVCVGGISVLVGVGVEVSVGVGVRVRVEVGELVWLNLGVMVMLGRGVDVASRVTVIVAVGVRSKTDRPLTMSLLAPSSTITPNVMPKIPPS